MLASTPKVARIWNEETEKLRAVVVRLAQGMPRQVGFKLPPSVFRNNPSDDVVQERITAFLRDKGLQTLDPNEDQVAAFQKKVIPSSSFIH